MDNNHYRYCFSCEKWKTKAEINEVKGKSPKEIEKEVNQDIFEKKLSQRKFSRGT